MKKGGKLTLEFQDISKSYPGVLALDKVSLSVNSGEIVGIIGENGAGKSTLMKILGGLIGPSSGQIIVDDIIYKRLTIEQSFGSGIAFVHQELNVFDNLDVAGNILLGREIFSGKLRLLDNVAMQATVNPILKRLGANFVANSLASTLSLAEKQLMEIAKALSMDARLIIMDEPTSSLTASETNILLTIIGELKADGIGVVFISHRLNEIIDCADRVIALRDGQVVGHLAKAEISKESMIQMMVGRKLSAFSSASTTTVGGVMLEVKAIVTHVYPNESVDFNVNSGEIIGIAGLVGSGRSEFVQAIFGIDKKLNGEVFIDGELLKESNSSHSIAKGLYLVPEDRKDCGLILDFAIDENIALPDLKSVSQRGLINLISQQKKAEQQQKNLNIVSPSVATKTVNLSGGNQQKVVLGKWLAMQPKVMIFDEPTRGIDVGSKAEIYQIMRELSEQGVAIIMISSDMEEVITISDRIAVMRKGQISGILNRSEFSEENILTLAVE